MSERLTIRVGRFAYYRSDITGEWLCENDVGTVTSCSGEVSALLDRYAPLLLTARPISKQQARVLDAFTAFYVKQGYAPKLKEIGTLIGKAESTVHEIIVGLERRGWLHRTRHGYRSLYTPTAAALERHAQRTRAR